MVDVREVIEPKAVTGEVDLAGKVVFSPLWLAVHRRTNNLLLKQDFPVILDSSKFSWRMMAEMLLELEDGGIPTWSKLEWVLFDLQKHSIAALRVTDSNHLAPLNFVVGDNSIEPGSFVYGWNKDGNPATYRGVTAQSERKFNQVMMKLFGKKFPIRLKSMSPIKGEVTVSVPVEKAKPQSSAMDKLNAALKD